MIKTILLSFFYFFSSVAFSESESADRALFDGVMKDYSFDEYFQDGKALKSKEKLVEVEEKIEKLKKVALLHPDEPRVYFGISQLYGVRDDMLHTHLIFKDRMDWTGFRYQ